MTQVSLKSNFIWHISIKAIALKVREGKYQEPIQPSTTPDTGHHIGKAQEHHTQKSHEVNPFPKCDLYVIKNNDNRRYEGRSICNENAFVTPSLSALGFHTICETKDQILTFQIMPKTLFYLSYSLSYRLLKTHISHSYTLFIFSSGLQRWESMFFFLKQTFYKHGSHIH